MAINNVRQCQLLFDSGDETNECASAPDHQLETGNFVSFRSRFVSGFSTDSFDAGVPDSLCLPAGQRADE